ncbi:MAG: hypothetical protein JJE17_05135 [Peptostreptococcaceae bacterium]|nr:hypothetical protein [Peptostreptococcaceae bacterium]
MKIEFSKEFEKAIKKLSGKKLNSVRTVIMEVRAAEKINQLTNCKKLVGYSYAYRIRIGDLRVLFILQIKGDTVEFEYLVSRGEAYSKKIQEQLRKKDN